MKTFSVGEMFLTNVAVLETSQNISCDITGSLWLLLYAMETIAVCH